MTDKSEKLSEKLYKDILKHGNKNMDKFLKKGAKPELVLDAWSYGDESIDTKIVLDLFSKIEIENIDKDSRYFYRAISLFIKVKSVEEIVEYAKQIDKTLEVVMDGYKEAVVYNRNMNLVNKYSQVISESINNNVEVSLNCLKTLLYTCSQIPMGDISYEDRDELMENSYSLLKQICSTNIIVSTEKDKVGALKHVGSPVTEDDEVCIEYVYNICKLLISKGANLKADENSRHESVLDSICRKDISNKLREKLERYYDKTKKKNFETNKVTFKEEDAFVK